MAEILREYETGLGWAVDVKTETRTETVYFHGQPTNEKRDAQIAIIEVRWIAEQEAAEQEAEILEIIE